MNPENEVRDVLERFAPDRAATLDLATPLNELGIASLDVIEIVFMLEERFDISLPFEANVADSDGLGTIGDLVDLVVVELRARGERATN